MIASDAALQIIERYERDPKSPASAPRPNLKAYRCPSDKLTIGWGHTKGVREGQVITADEADDLLATDLEMLEHFLGQVLPSGVNACQFSALVSFVYNVGAEAFAGGRKTKPSTLLTKLQAGDAEGAAAEFPRWIHGSRFVPRKDDRGRNVLDDQGQPILEKTTFALPGLVARRAEEQRLFLTRPS